MSGLIIKLYDMLHLDQTALRFSLFLCHISMDANIEPKINVMTRAWYSIVPTGAQAAIAINMLSELFTGTIHMQLVNGKKFFFKTCFLKISKRFFTF